MTITKRSTSDFPRTLTSIEIRARCIQEILTTEREYVQHLQDIVEVGVVCTWMGGCVTVPGRVGGPEYHLLIFFSLLLQGFLEQCEQHSKLFTPDIIGAIFSNIKEIYRSQNKTIQYNTV